MWRLSGGRKLRNPLSVCIFIALVAPAGAIAQELRLQTQFPSTPDLREYFDTLTRRLKATAVTTAPISVLLEYVAQGRLDGGWALPSIWARNELAFGMAETVPLVLDTSSIERWRNSPSVKGTLDRIYSQRGAKGLVCGALPRSGGLWTRKPVSAETMLTGLKLRVVEPVLSALLSGVGVVGSSIPAGETLPAMQVGMVDGAIGLTPQEDLRLGYSQEAKYYYLNSLLPIRDIHLVLSLRKWEMLGDAGRETIAKECAELTERMLRELPSSNAVALERMRASGVTVSDLPAELEDELRKSSRTIYERMRSRSVGFSALYEAALDLAPEFRNLSP